MRVEMELDFNKYCVVDGSPTTVLPAPPRSKTVNRKSSRKPKCENSVLPLDENAAEMRFDRYRSVSCNDAQSRRSNQDNNVVIKRGSVYQSTKEVKWLQSSDNDNGRKKIEFSRESAPALPFEIIDSLCGLDDDAMEMEQDMFLEMSCSERREGDHTLTSDSAVASTSLHKSVVAKFPLQSASDGSEWSSPNPWCSHAITDPNFRSHRSPLSCVSETGSDANKTPLKSLPNDPPANSSDHHDSALLHSPAHLHGLLRSKKKHGLPVFEFSVKSLEDVYTAKAWKLGNSLNWVYTFHSVSHKRSNGSTLKFRDGNRESSMVGQMVVSCSLCTQFNSMVTEFVLYDIAHSRITTTSQDSNATDDIMSRMRNKVQAKHCRDSAQLEPSASQPLAAAELHPGLEIAATVIQVPFGKRESLKFKNGERKISTARPKLQDLCQIDMPQESLSDTDPGKKIHVVIPSGIHGLPDTESHRPSPLLERWRLGGQCDCGGWDVACPLNILTSQNYNTVLFFQGKRDNVAAFSMRSIEKERYAVDFHAQLSLLQAFSISVAILHAAQASEQERTRHNSQMPSPAEEAISLADALLEDPKLTPNKPVDEILPSFVINPPFSPIARV